MEIVRNSNFKFYTKAFSIHCQTCSLTEEYAFFWLHWLSQVQGKEIVSFHNQVFTKQKLVYLCCQPLTLLVLLFSKACGSGQVLTQANLLASLGNQEITLQVARKCSLLASTGDVSRLQMGTDFFHSCYQKSNLSLFHVQQDLINQDVKGGK